MSHVACDMLLAASLGMLAASWHGAGVWLLAAMTHAASLVGVGYKFLM